MNLLSFWARPPRVLHQTKHPIVLVALSLGVVVTVSCGETSKPGPIHPGGSGGVHAGGDHGSGGEHVSTAGQGGEGGANPDGQGPVTPSFTEVGPEVNCKFEVKAALAPAMPTVGIVEFSASGLHQSITGAVVQFGIDLDHVLEAPVDLNAASYRTLLLGMKSATKYWVKVGVSSSSEHCYSPPVELTTGGLRAGVLPLIETAVHAPPTSGFIVGAQGPNAIIFDQDGDVVWGYSFQSAGSFAPSCGAGGGVTRIFAAKLSYDGRYMLARDLGPFDCGNGGSFYRVALDGSSLERIDLLGGDHHDFTVTPSGIAYIAKEEKGGYDKIYVANTDGSDARELLDLEHVVDVYPKGGGPGEEKSHFNSIHYWEERDVYTVSNRESDAIVEINGDGTIARGVGKSAKAQFITLLAESTMGQTETPLWRVQHGHDWYAPDKLLVFSNGDFIGGQANALHYTVNDDGIAQLDWSYNGMGNSVTQGDIQMLPNGHVLVCASNGGRLQEIDENRELIVQYHAPSEGFGYVMYRPTLYGAPPDGR
jgi:hypothetical protein